MSITATTLSGAVAVSDTVIGVASASGISNPTSQTGAGVTLLKVDDEVMAVVSFSGLQVVVLRGQYGTQVVSHLTAAPVLIGAPSDFPNFVPNVGTFSTQLPYNFTPIGAAIASATTITPSGGYVHHVTGTTALSIITVPAACIAGGAITLVFDGSGSGLTWGAGGNIAVAGTSTTAGSAVTFFYDPTSAKWHPSRVA